MIGGFLGAGKTTAVLKLAEHLVARGLSVGLITNDQSVGLVDTAMLSAHGFDVREITGGCFCCRFNSLLDAAEQLSTEKRPDVFIAEPVGSCTDLKASVSYPLRRIYGDDFSVAPLSVLLDPIRAMRILGLEEGRAFSPKVLYVYGKQLEEAELIVINKTDLLDPDRRRRLRDALTQRYPKARVLEVSARDGSGLTGWFDAIAGGELGSAPTMDVDYELYADGEALLGWLNATVELSSPVPADGNELLLALAKDVQSRLKERDAQIAHLKMTLSPTDGGNDLAVLNLVRSDSHPEASHQLQAPIETGELIINLRAEADPALLNQVTTAALQSLAHRRNITLQVEHSEHFRPGKPEPTHRFAEA